MFEDCVVELPEGIVIVDDNDDVDILLKQYTFSKMSSNSFDPVLFGQKAKWTYADRATATQDIEIAVKWATEKSKDLKEEKRINLAANLARLKKYDFESEEGKWGRFWTKLKDIHEAMQIAKDRKRAATATLIEDVKRVAKEFNTGTTEETHKEHSRLEQLLNTNIWAAITPVEIPLGLKKILEQLEFQEEKVFIVDLRSSNADFLAQFDDVTFEEYGKYLESRFNSHESGGIEEFLESLWLLFSKSSDVKNWEREIEELTPPSDEILQKVLNVVKKTFPTFIRAYSSVKNPLLNDKTLECEVLNDYVHPIFKEALFQFSQTTWLSGEISNSHFVSRDKADGVAIIPGRELPVAYFEGSRLKPDVNKGLHDAQKILENAVSILSTITFNSVREKKRIPVPLSTFVSQLNGPILVLGVVECIGKKIFVHEYDLVNLPRTERDLDDAKELYLSIIGWT
ncbi:hypothetical protein HK096_006217, partial [Nowakowskiella sp. JEL0078]